MDERDGLVHAIAELAEQVGCKFGDVSVVAFENVMWLDEAMGCPEPGKSYQRAHIQGYRIVLHAKGKEAVYHGATGRLPFRCDQASDAAHLEAENYRGSAST